MLTTDRFEQLKLKASLLREELHTEVDRIVNEVTKFKLHVQKGLEDYEYFVAEEVEQELSGVGEEDETMRVDID